MIWPDIVNGIYEIGAGLFLLLSCFKLYHDKEVRGWSLPTQIFFTTWAYWNLYYYFHLNQFVSWIGGMIVVLTNTAWTSMAIHYWKHPEKKYTKIMAELDHGL